MEDYELMHRMIENERSERMEETIFKAGIFSKSWEVHRGQTCGRMGIIPHDCRAFERNL